MENSCTMSEEIKNRILDERAQKIAVKGCEEEVKTLRNKVVMFGLDGECYAIEAAYIKEVYPLIDATPLPCVPSWIYGVINVRRKIYSVVDLKRLFDLTGTETTTEKKIIILERGATSFAILTDEIYGVKEIELNQLQQKLPTQIGRCKEFFIGITRDRVIVLNGERMISSDTLIVNDVVDR